MTTADRPRPEGWTPPGVGQRYRLLESSSSIAIVGASSNPARASNFVATYLVGSTDFEIHPVHPREDEILGRPAVGALPDIVDVFRRPEDCPGVAEEAVAVGAKVLWLQRGIWSEDAARIALDGGLDVVMDRCLKIEHARFHGGLHLAGFDTGVISSRRARG